MYGRHEGRHPNPSLDLHWTPRLPESGPEVAGRATDELDFSVIIPTYNRKALLPGVLEAWKRVAEQTRFPYEIIFSDDGSEDGSVELLEQYTELPIRILRNQHGGASNARNAAIRVAKGKRLLIIGDDIFPDPMILNVHAELGKRLGPNVATLGVVDWHPELEVNHLMRHITEVGNEQFSFNRLKDGQCVDFRHFYTCNIAVDRDFLLGEKVIFDEAFHKYGFEDVELGYRLCMRGMRIYFTTAAKGDHFHPYRVDSFCRRQASAGEMAVVFRDMHAATSQILGIDSLQRAYERSKANSAEPLELWESRRDWLVARCEFYENVISTLDGRPATFVTECLSEIYSRLFKAMYEYGVLLAITRHPEVIAFTLARNFPGKWNKLWGQMGRAERVTVDEAREALRESRFNMAGTEDDIVLADLKLIRQLAAELGSQVAAHRGTLHMLRRALHYLRHDPRYLAARVSSLFTPQLPGKPAATPVASMRTEPLTLAVVLRPGLADAAALEQRYRAAFTSGVVFYQADEAGQVRTLGGDMGQVRGDRLTEEMVYCPASVASALSPDHLYMASLALALNGLDLAIVSHDLQDNGNLRCATLHDQTVFSGATFAAMQAAGGSVRGPLRGKLLRMLPAQDVAGMRDAQLADVLGQDIEFESSDQLIFHHGDAARRASGFPAMQLPPSEKPVVFVLPVFLAVGGVERNTVEVMRQLRDRYDFVVITMERLRVEQGSLAAQASEVATHVLELSEACAHGQYLDVLKQWKTQLRPDLVWICNGSPWLCDELGALREVFFDVPIVDQKVYDAQMGWITRYGDGATRTLDRFIAINKKIYQRFVADFRIDPARIDLIYSVIDASKFESHTPTGDRAAIRQAFGLPEAKRTFVFMGRLVAQKRPLEFLRLAASRRNQDELYVLVGDGELASAAEDYIQETGLSNVVRIPYVANTADLFSVTDGLIVTSSYEGLPIAMLEAMAMGVPVLATDVGDIADVLADFDAGEAVPEANPASVMANRMDGWQSRLERYRRSLSEKRGELRKRFSSNSIAAQYEACWRAAANGYRGKARE
jgi:glycosyltransferase involved in cell wall biosynthesis